MMQQFPPPFVHANAYWIVGSSADVYSSKQNIYVSASDPDYVTWKDAMGDPPTMPDEATLWPMMSHLPQWLFNGTTFAQPAEGEYTKDQLAAYSAMKRYEVEVAGTVSNSQPLRTDRISRAAVTQAVAYLNANPAATFNWKTLTGFQAVDQQTVRDFDGAIHTHVQGCFDIEKTTLDGITAGSITTLAQVDAAYQTVRERSAKLKDKIEA
jgi:hypothetical protein